VLAGIQYVETEPVLETHVRADIRKKLKLVPPAHVECSTPEVLFYVPVQKFTEGSVEIPVRAVNVRDDLVLRTFPDKVQVRFLVPLSRYAQVKSGLFEAMVDASEATPGGSSVACHCDGFTGYVGRFVEPGGWVILEKNEGTRHYRWFGQRQGTVCRIFSVLGIPVYEADAEVKKLYSGNKNLATFWPSFSGTCLTTMVPDTQVCCLFFNKDALEQLNSLVHPLSGSFPAMAGRRNPLVIVKEAAIPFESGSDSDCDKTAPSAHPALRMDRVAERDRRPQEKSKSWPTNGARRNRKHMLITSS
jgi:dephospho-CoA kinase